MTVTANSDRATLITLPQISGLPGTPADLVSRDSVLNSILKMLDLHDIVLIEGEEGTGKTTTLLDFVWQHANNTISHFVDPNYTYTFSYDCILDNLYRQIHFYCLNVEDDSVDNIDTGKFNSLAGRLFKKSKNSKVPLYFVFDGFEALTAQQLERVASIFDTLPWGKAKFIFTGTKDILDPIIGTKKLRKKEILISNFGINETKLYFSNICDNEKDIVELHKLSEKGFPEKLKQIKLLCQEYGVEKFLLSDDFSEKTNFLDLHWKKVDQDDDELIQCLALIAFNDTYLELESIAKILSANKAALEQKLNELHFVEITDLNVRFHTETFRKYVKAKLKSCEDTINDFLIAHYESNETNAESIYNLPLLYQKAKKWEKLTKFYSTDAFIRIIERYQTMSNVRMHLSQGLDASKKTSSKFNEAFIRFALHKSSAKELERNYFFEQELEARIALNDYDQAFILANSAFLKEDRLKLLAVLAKQRKLQNLSDDKALTDQIRPLYDQIDFSVIQEKGFEIAALLIYSCFDLAIDLVEKISNSTASKNSLDYAFAYLSLFASEANKKSNSSLVNIDVLNAKIQNSDVKNLASAMTYLSDEFNSSEIISKVDALPKFSHRLFLMKSWIAQNENNPSVGEAIKYTLEDIVKASSENVPNATSLSEIAKPLPLIHNAKILDELIQLFDAQRTTIDRPTRDYIDLQLTIAQAFVTYDIERAKDRVFDVYLLIDDLNDLAIKTDCLCLLWLWLLKNDKDSSIEKTLSSVKGLQEQVEENIAKLLKDTAYHYKMVEFSIKKMVPEKVDFVVEIIKALNTVERRDVAYKLAAVTYIKESKIETIDFSIIGMLYKNIKEYLEREEIVVEIIDKFFDGKGKSISHIAGVLPYYDLIATLSNIEDKCNVITRAVSILNYAGSTYSAKIKELLDLLKISWDSIDSRSLKIEIGFKISKNLAEQFKEEARAYLQLSTELKQSEAFSSKFLLSTYINSVRLSIRAFCGLVVNRDDLDKELNQLDAIIAPIQSIHQRLELWSELALRIYSYGKKDLFDQVFKNYIDGLLTPLSKADDGSKLNTIVKVAPSIYLHNQNLFLFDYLPHLSKIVGNYALYNICEYILTKSLPGDLRPDHTKTIELSYSELNDLCILIERISDDGQIYGFIKKVVGRIKEYRTSLSNEHRNSIKQKLKKIIDTKLPTPTGIQHDGYKVVSEASLLTLEQFKQDEWDHLIKRARLIPNGSDRSLVLTMLAGLMNTNSKNRKIELIDEAFGIIKSNPSIFDKTNRFDATWDVILDIDRGKFLKFLNTAFQDLLQSREGEIVGLRNLIDVAHQHDPKLAEQYVTMLDQDESRRRLKAPLQRRIENNTKIKEACSENSHIENLDADLFEEVFNKKLEDFNEGKLIARDIHETLSIIEKASTFSLSESLEAYLYFIQNANKKLEKNKKEIDVLQSIYNATVENSKLIAILSSDNINKMKNLYTAGKQNSEASDPVIEVGKRNDALEYITNWIQGHPSINRIFIIDPYFTEKDLFFLKTIQQLTPNSPIVILTSKKGKNNSHYDLENSSRSTNKEVYIHHWNKISSDLPPDVTIKVVWDKDSKECPFHDRWYCIGEGEACLHIGTSLNGLGNRDSQIVELQGDSLIEVRDLIGKYIYREEGRVNNFNLKYERFDLES